VFQVRIHGRGGQGVVTASEMLALAAFLEGRHAQAFPSFGSERTGAPVASFVRISDDPIRVREPVMTPDAVIVQDVTLLHRIDVFAGLRPDGFVVINSAHELQWCDVCPPTREGDPERLVSVNATEIAVRHIGRPVPSAALLGAFAALTGLVTIESVVSAVHERLPGKVGVDNAAAATETYRLVTARASSGGLSRAPSS